MEAAKGEFTVRVTGGPFPVMTTCREEITPALLPVTVNTKPLNPTASPLELVTLTSITGTPEAPDNTVWLWGFEGPAPACTRGWVGVAVTVDVEVEVGVPVEVTVLVLTAVLTGVEV